MPTKQYIKKLNGYYVKDEEARQSADKRLLKFDTIADLQNANFNAGDAARVLGKEAYNDGFGADYRIREKGPEDDPDGDNIIEINNELVAEKIKDFEAKENVALKVGYINKAPIYITEISNIAEIKVKPTATTLADYEHSTNINDYDRANSDYDIFVNAGVGDTNNNVRPLGWVLTDTESMENAAVSYNAITAIKADNSIDNFALSTYSDIEEMQSDGYVNCITAYDCLIKNNRIVAPQAPYRDNINLFGQLANGNIVLFHSHGRLLNSKMTWQQIGEFILDRYPTMRIVTIHDGGGSAQLFNKDSTLIPNTSRTAGRAVATIICIKTIKENQ